MGEVQEDTLSPQCPWSLGHPSSAHEMNEAFVNRAVLAQGLFTLSVAETHVKYLLNDELRRVWAVIPTLEDKNAV